MIDIICIRGIGDKQGQEIEDPLITSEPIAVKRGTDYINRNWYKQRMRTLLSPYKSNMEVGNIAAVNVGELGISGNHIITGVRILLSTKGIQCNLAVEQYSEGR
jgi:hypothetical protein